MLRFKFVFLLLIICCTQVSGQVVVVQNGDKLYQDYIMNAEDTVGHWVLKDSLPQGKYWVIQKTACKRDTLVQGQYIEGGKKHGIWTRWEASVCMALIDDETGEELEWNSAPAEMYDQVKYDSGHVVSRSWFFYESGKARVRFFYPEKTTDISHWNREEIWSQEEVLVSVFEEDAYGNVSLKGFYDSGKLKFQEKTDQSGNSIKPTIYYHENSQIWAEGKFRAGEDSFRFKRVNYKHGVWHFWDEQENLIAKVWFKLGEIQRSKVYKTSDLSIEEILDGL